MKKYVLLALLCSYSALFSQGLAFSRIIILPYELPSTQATYNGSIYEEFIVPQGKVWKVSAWDLNDYAYFLSRLNPNSLTGINNGSTLIKNMSELISTSTSNEGVQDMWFSDNYSILFAGNFYRESPITIIEYDVIP